MAKTAIVTDSTVCLPVNKSNGLPLTIIPLNLIWGSETQLDGVDIQPTQFYLRLKDSPVVATTSQPPPKAFKDVYDQLFSQGYDGVLVITISSKLSGTMDSAVQAKNMLPEANIELVDSMQAGMGLGFPVLLAARAARDGASLEECKQIAEKACSKIKTYLVASTLEYLRRGGRIGGGAAFLGTALNLKPILVLKDGRVDAYQKIRTMRKALDRLAEILVTQLEERQQVRLSVMHANASHEANMLLQMIRQDLDPGVIAEEVLTEVSPVIGAHTGPGTIGISFMSGM